MLASALESSLLRLSVESCVGARSSSLCNQSAVEKGGVVRGGSPAGIGGAFAGRGPVVLK